MAYLQTTAASVSDMLDTIGTFAVGLGWTIERNNTFTSGANTRRILSLSFAGVDYAHFFSQLNNAAKTEIYCARSIGLTTSLDVLSNPNRSNLATTSLLGAGPYVNFWLFGEAGSTPYIHCVVEHASGRYRHFGIGNLVKAGTWTGGSYHYGTTWDQGAVNTDTPGSAAHYTPFGENNNSSDANGGVRCDDCDTTANNITGVDNRYLPYQSTRSRKAMTGIRGGTNTNNFPYVDEGMGVQNFAFSNYNQRSHLIRIAHFVPSSGGFFRYIGDPPAIRAMNFDPYQAAEEFTIGTDTWKVFPLIRKGILTDVECSGYYGMAYKKVI